MNLHSITPSRVQRVYGYIMGDDFHTRSWLWKLENGVIYYRLNESHAWSRLSDRDIDSYLSILRNR